MANEKFIKDKRDNAHHAGKHSERMRIEAKPLDLDAYYLSEHDLVEDGFLPVAHQEFYVGVEGRLLQVPQVIYDGRMDMVKGQISKIRAELTSFIKRG